MGNWRRLLAKLVRPSGRGPNPDLNCMTWPTGDGTQQATCPFCSCGTTNRSLLHAGYPIWECECGALGSGSSMYPDLDEVADSLLATLGIAGSVGEPSIPTCSSGMVFMQHYDIPRSLNQLRAILQVHDFEMQTNTWKEAGHEVHAIWVRRKIA